MIVLNRIYTPGAVWTHTLCSHELEVDEQGQVGQVPRLGLGSKHGVFSHVDRCTAKRYSRRAMTGCISSCKIQLLSCYEHVTNDACIKPGGNYAGDTTIFYSTVRRVVKRTSEDTKKWLN
jgi:hypothetical protein